MAKKETAATETVATATTTATQTEQLLAQAADKRSRAATLIEQAEAIEQTAQSLGKVFETEPGTVVRAKRRDGSVVEAVFVAAKDTGRGILVAVTVGTGFDAENLRLPLSNVYFDQAEAEAVDPLAGVESAAE